MQDRRHISHTLEYITQHGWKPIAAIVYLIICLFDFVVVPTFIGLTREPYEQIIPLVKELDPQVQQVVLSRDQWQPLTLMGGGMFHLAFGALLTGAAVTGKKFNISNGSDS